MESEDYDEYGLFITPDGQIYEFEGNNFEYPKDPQQLRVWETKNVNEAINRVPALRSALELHKDQAATGA